jgi:uncharacterized protein involved in exopolysaccharide biosynthesis
MATNSTEFALEAAKTRNDVGMSFRDLVMLFAAQKLAILVIILSFTLASIAAVFLVPEKFEATVIVSPVSDQSGSDHSGGLTSQLGGLASLAGIASPGSSKKSESIAILQSEALTETYIKDNDLLPVLYKSKWDSKAQRWKSSDISSVPTLWRANRYFKASVRRVSEDTKTGLVTLAITWKDPVTAAKWANDLVKLTNDYQRDKAIKNSERRIAYLNDEAAKATVLEVKTSIYSLMETEIKEETIARGSDEYALKVIDPAFVPEKPSFPLPWLWIGLGAFSGILVSIIFVLVRADWHSGAS